MGASVSASVAEQAPLVDATGVAMTGGRERAGPRGVTVDMSNAIRTALRPSDVKPHGPNDQRLVLPSMSRAGRDRVVFCTIGTVGEGSCFWHSIFTMGNFLVSDLLNEPIVGAPLGHDGLSVWAARAVDGNSPHPRPGKRYWDLSVPERLDLMRVVRRRWIEEMLSPQGRVKWNEFVRAGIMPPDIAAEASPPSDSDKDVTKWAEQPMIQFVSFLTDIDLGFINQREAAIHCGTLSRVDSLKRPLMFTYWLDHRHFEGCAFHFEQIDELVGTLCPQNRLHARVIADLRANYERSCGRAGRR